MRNSYFTQTCSRCNKVYNAGMVLHCRHPKVEEIYGDNICMYCCKRCMHHTSTPYIDGVKCGFKEGEHRV